MGWIAVVDDLRNRTVRSIVWKFLERSGYSSVQLLAQVVLARLLLPADFGLVAILLVFINVGNVLVQSGLNTALVQSTSIEDGESPRVSRRPRRLRGWGHEQTNQVFTRGT